MPKALQVKTRTYKVAANLLSTPHMPNLGFYISSSCITDVKSKTFQKEFSFKSVSIHYLETKQKKKEKKRKKRKKRKKEKRLMKKSENKTDLYPG